jgi:hypothetical protein
MFSEQDIKLVLKNFPKFELCYEIITHKKVLGSSAILAIPEGKKCFAWFTSYKNDNVCFLLEINESKHIVDVQIITTSFIDKLALGTIFYGTSFKNKNNNYFCVEDMYYYAGKSCYNYTYLSKLEKLKDIFKNEISQTALFNKFTIFGLPLILNDLQLIIKEIQLLPYKVSDIKFRFFENENSKKILVMKYFKPGSQKQENNMRKEAIFKITPDIEPDIYNLFIYKNGTEEYYDIAFIPDYKTSVMMNKLFRNIKENDNLDAIEESDNEEEFEDSREDKYVYLDRSFKMKCEYNNKFKRWVPLSLAGKSDRIISISSLKNY